MKKAFYVILSVVLAIGLIAILNIEFKQQQLEDKIKQSAKPEIEEPVKLVGDWQIILFQAGIVPTKIIKTNSFFVKDKVVWYQDESTGDELPLPEGSMVLPDDGRDLEQYGVYDIDFYNSF
jgi:hypothetical protein